MLDILLELFLDGGELLGGQGGDVDALLLLGGGRGGGGFGDGGGHFWGGDDCRFGGERGGLWGRVLGGGGLGLVIWVTRG